MVAFTIDARPGVRVRVEATLDDTRDTPPVQSDDLRVDTSGVLRVRLPLDDTRAWYWRVAIDGVPLDGGVVPPAR